jgi:O-methyltransferase
MSILSNIFKRTVLDKKIEHSILIERGNIHEAFPSDFSVEEQRNIASVKDMTMTSLERLVSLSRAVDYIVKSKIAGDIVECGVWKGGSMMLVAQKLIQLNERNRSLYLFDTFEGMTAPDERDVSALDNRKAKELMDEVGSQQGGNGWCYSSLDEVKSNLAKTNYPAEKLFYVKGKVEDTLPLPAIGKIALLRLDTDWYESTKHELETLYDSLVTGGVLIIDDYGHWSGSKKAVDEFFEKRQLKIFLSRIDYTGRLAIKM